MKAIFGLGNYGREYAGTRHNMGFDTITRMSDILGIKLDTKRFKGLCGFGFIGSEKVILVQPQTYMNLSGECVRAVIDFFKLSNKDVIVIYDDISLEPGQLRVRKKGSAGGHNGMKSIIAHLGTEEFDRVRVGVGAKPEGWDLADYVLGRFPKEQESEIRRSIADAADACETIVREGIDAAMNIYNKKPEKPENQKKNKKAAKAQESVNPEQIIKEEHAASKQIAKQEPANPEQSTDSTEET